MQVGDVVLRNAAVQPKESKCAFVLQPAEVSADCAARTEGGPRSGDGWSQGGVPAARCCSRQR